MPPSPGHFCASSVTAAPWGQKKQERAMSQSQRVTGPEADIAGIMFRLATATTKSNTRSRRPSTRSRPGFFLPVGMGLANVVLPYYFVACCAEFCGGLRPDLLYVAASYDCVCGFQNNFFVANPAMDLPGEAKRH